MLNKSSDLFTNPFLFAHTHMLSLGAHHLMHIPVSSEEQEEIFSTALAAPDIALFYNSNSASALRLIAKTTTKVMKQKFIAHWTEQNNPLLKHVKKVQQADAFLRARLNHLSKCEIRAFIANLIFQLKSVCNFDQTSFLSNILSMINAEFSSFQLGQYLQLVLGLDFPPQLTSDGNCPCGRANDSTGCHRLNCTKCEGRQILGTRAQCGSLCACI